MAAAKKKKLPGKNIPNALRHTKQKLFRLPPEYAERIEELAAEWRITEAGVIARLIDEYDGDDE